MSPIAGNQARTALVLLRELEPLIGRDRALPAQIQTRLAKEKRFGSRDRRLYRELLYTAVRHWPWVRELQARGDEAVVRALVWLATPMPALSALLEAHPRPEPYPDTLAGRAALLGVQSSLLPAWTARECPEAGLPPEIEVLHTRAPLWLRLREDAREGVLAEFSTLGWSWRTTPASAAAIELSSDVDVTRTLAFERGGFEVQDLGSQLLLPLAAPAIGQRWLDACAGAGGKTLQLAELLGPQGAVDAHDIRESALAELVARSRRAGAKNVSLTRSPKGEYDGVLVDAPCSGSGTWRRAPHLKWCTSEADLARAAERQLRLLRQFSAHVRPGGTLVYATCSLARRENEDVVRDFLAHSPAFARAELAGAPGEVATDGKADFTIWPSRWNTDGFFVAKLVRAA